MLQKEYRLDKKEIPNIARRGKKFSSEFFDIKVWFDDLLDFPKFAISISIKIDKRAVVRNTIKRKIRSAIQNIIKENNVRKGMYLIIVKSSELKDQSSDEIKNSIRHLQIYE